MTPWIKLKVVLTLSTDRGGEGAAEGWPGSGSLEPEWPEVTHAGHCVYVFIRQTTGLPPGL